MVTQQGTGEAVEGLVIGLRGANAQQVVDSVRERLAQIAPTLPKGMHTSTFYDRGSLVERAISNVSHALGEACVLVLVLLFLFLGNVRAAVAVIIILPLAALATFLAMRLQGLSANLMSLGGLAIAIGMLVDAAVVVVENIEAHQSQPGAGRHSRLHVIYRATSEVAAPVTAEPAGPGRQAVQTGGHHHRVCTAGIAAAVADRGAGCSQLAASGSPFHTTPGAVAGGPLPPPASMGPAFRTHGLHRRRRRAACCRSHLHGAGQVLHAHDG
jgi:hypothetical protein